MTSPPRQHDRLVGIACLVLCPLVSGIFFGAVAVVLLSPDGGVNALHVAALAAGLAFAANLIAICAVAAALEHSARHRAQSAVHEVFELTRDC